ncbi:MAG: SMP-30/gluconolactonase/LRE family protein [Deltaproteobacteria bacterium]|nr:MAG: SMP-30/gluconolactonase/LRE family protein [Deltaproteobacteria bacterium]
MDLETLAWGYGLIEGPRADAAGGLYFSDVTRGGVYRRERDGGVATVVPKRRGVGGIALHRDGGLVISGRDVCHVRAGATRILLERPPGVGGFNDLFTDAAGRVYVGSLRSDPFDLGREREAGELYRIDPGGAWVALYGDVGLSNGIGFSPDGAILYHADSAAGQILAHEVDADGRTSNRRVFASLEGGAPDGLAVDAQGGVWVASFGGGAVHRFTPDGARDRRIAIPASHVTSLCFGGADGCDLYVVSADNTERPERGGTIFRARSEIPGLPAPPARV